MASGPSWWSGRIMCGPLRTDGDVGPLGRRGEDQRSGMLPANRAVAFRVVMSSDWTTW